MDQYNNQKNEELLQEIRTHLENGRAKKVAEAVINALDNGVSVQSILEDGLLAGMNHVSDRFRSNELYVPDVLISAHAMSAGTAALRPYIVSDNTKSSGTVVIGTVKGDLHDIGKALVKMMMEGHGLKVIDIGVNNPAERFVAAARESNADVIACSALLTSTIHELKNVVDAVAASELSGRVKVMIGGAPVTQEFCDFVHADCYTDDAVSAAIAAVRLCNRM